MIQEAKNNTFIKLWTEHEIFAARAADFEEPTWKLLPPQELLPEELARHPEANVPPPQLDAAIAELFRAVETQVAGTGEAPRNPEEIILESEDEGTPRRIPQDPHSGYYWQNRYHNVSPGTEAAMEAETQDEVQRWLREVEADRQQAQEDEERERAYRQRPPSPTIRQRLITFAAKHRTRLADDTQLHIYSTMATTDIEDDDLFRLIDSSYPSRDSWLNILNRGVRDHRTRRADPWSDSD